MTNGSLSISHIDVCRTDGHQYCRGIEVHRLTPSDNDNEDFQSQQVYFCKNEKQLGYARLEGDYVVVESELDITVVNWKDSWRVHITTVS